jgi:hypothetical protein
MSALLATTDVTANKLAEMFTENTGRHMLDSGSAYGRAWERNAGMVASDFLARPTVRYDAEYGGFELDMFHFLNERLTYVPTLTADFTAFDADRPDDSWSDNMNEWLDMLGVPAEGGDFYSDARWDFNTYNSDNLLSGTFQGVKFGYEGNEYFALQIHGGCDVRGGYTAYKIFTGEIDSLICDMNSAYLRCSDCDFYASYEGNTLSDYSLGDSPATSDMLIEVAVPTTLPDSWHAEMGCPICKIALV